MGDSDHKHINTEVPKQGTRAPIVLTSGTISPWWLYHLCTPVLSGNLFMSRPPSLQTTKSRDGFSFPFSLYLSTNCWTLKTLLLHCHGFESKASCEMQRFTIWEPAKPLAECLCLRRVTPMGTVCSWSVDPKSRKGLGRGPGRGWPVISFLDEEDANQVMVRLKSSSPASEGWGREQGHSKWSCFKILRLYVGGRSRFPEFPGIWVPAWDSHSLPCSAAQVIWKTLANMLAGELLSYLSHSNETSVNQDFVFQCSSPSEWSYELPHF